MTDKHKLLIEENSSELYQTAPCGHISTKADGTIVNVNETLLSWTGYSRHELVSCRRFQDLLTTPGRLFYETQYVPLLQLQGFVKEVALELICNGREPLQIVVNSTYQKIGETVLIQSAFFDATDRSRYEKDLLLAKRELEAEVRKRTVEIEAEVAVRKLAQENLQELTAKLLRLRDDERRRLARELHDSVGQMLAALSMNLALIEAESDSLSPVASAAVSENARWVNEISAEIRTISHLLHPPLLDEVGLTSALTWYVDGLAQRAGMKINLEMPPHLGRLPEEQELAVFRIVQECLTNVHRHSGSKTAAVRLVLTADSVRVEVQDQGKGIGSARLAEIKSLGSGVGLRGMRERARQLGGNIEVTSSRRGTLVTATFPKRKRKISPPATL